MYSRQTTNQKDFFKQEGLHFRTKKESKNNEINIISNNTSELRKQGLQNLNH